MASVLPVVKGVLEGVNVTVTGSSTSANTGLLPGLSVTSLAVALLVGYIVFYILAQLVGPKDPTKPPVVFHFVPVIGSAVSYGIDPYAFFDRCRRKYGDVFTFVLLNKKITVALGPSGSNLVLNGKLSEVNAEEAYSHLTTPVFGEGVAYDVPNSVLVQQKKFIKYGLSTENFKRYVPLIVKEVHRHFDQVFVDGLSKASLDAFDAASEITICTASATLQGKEVRAALDQSFAQLFHDLDGGFTPINFVFPNLPLPSYRRRDRAQLTMSNFYVNIMKRRREAGEAEEHDDMISALQNQAYKDGRPLGDREVAHIMIALLMAGQHTSAATGSWLMLHLAERPDVVAELRQEQEKVFGKSADGTYGPLDYDQLHTPLLIGCIKEVLRLHPPIHSIMRKVKTPITVPATLAAPSESQSYIIPDTHYVMAAPGVSQLDSAHWRDPLAFDPSRWVNPADNGATGDDQSEQVDYGFGAISSGANSAYLPFGAGRHRCVGEQFAYVQLGTVLATIVRHFDLELAQPLPGPDYTTMLVCPKAPRKVVFTKRTS